MLSERLYYFRIQFNLLTNYQALGMLVKLRMYIIRTIFFLSIVSLGLLLTGSQSRIYSVLNDTSSVSVGSSSKQSKTFAQDILQNIQLNPNSNLNTLSTVYYEIIDDDKQWVVNYYFAWDEVSHPKFLKSLANKLWHFIYLKFSTIDIEYLQININKASGEVAKIKVKSDEIINPKSSTCLDITSQIHDFSFVVNCGTKRKLNLPLQYFDQSTYRQLKMARRSQGDFRTTDKIMNFPFIIFLALLATYYFRHIQKDYNNEYHSE